MSLDFDFLSIFLSLPGAIYLSDLEGNVLLCNDAEAEIFNHRTGEELVGKNLYSLVGEKNAPMVRESFEKVIRTGEEIATEEVHQNDDGTKIFFFSKKIPLRDKKGNIAGIAGVSLDITDRKRKEELEFELQQTKAYAEGQRDMAIELSHMASGIVHELRTPVTDGRLRTEFGKSYFRKTLDKYLADMLAGVPGVEQWSPKIIGRLRKFFDDLMGIFVTINEIITYNLATISRAMTGNLEVEDLQSCDFFKTFSKTVEHFPFTDEQRKKFHWERSYNFSFQGNALLFSLIMNNLLKNAFEQIEHKKKGEIFITSGETEEHYWIKIRDTAGGASPEILEKMFEGFFTTKQGGTGVGLPFCRRTVRAFGGDLTADSIEGDFMEFTLRFPKVPFQRRGSLYPMSFRISGRSKFFAPSPYPLPTHAARAGEGDS